MVNDVTVSDIDYLIERFKNLTARRVYEKPSDFVQRVRYLDKELTPFPGKFSYAYFPYFVEIVDCFAPDSAVKKVYVMKGSQLGATTGILEPCMLYYIMAYPAPQMYALPDEGMAKRAMATKIDSMIDGAHARHLIHSQTKKAARAKDTGDTTLSKQYSGGYLHAVGARSGSRFRNFSYKIILVDEIDEMPDVIPRQGSVEQLAINRSNAYTPTRKIYFGSSPTVEQTSKIYKLYLRGDQRKFFVPCKHCGKMQELQWAVWDESHQQIGGIVWENDENYQPKLDTVAYKCRFCGCLMKNYDKTLIMSNGEWRATAKSSELDARSYHISPFYNPPGMYSWEDAVVDWAACWDIKNNRIKDMSLYRVFRNTIQGLPFREQNISIRYEKAENKRRWGFVRGQVPNKIAERDAESPVLIVCCSVDVQLHNLFVDVKGYSARGVVWTIDFRSIECEPGKTVEDFGGVWDKLQDYIENSVFYDEEHKRGYRIAITLVDSGHYTEWVYAFCKRYSNSVYACKGMDWIPDGQTYRVFNKQTLQNCGLKVAFHINTGKMKDRIASTMSKDWNENEQMPDWFPNFPDDFRSDYFRMFEAEEKVEEIDKRTNKYIRTVWKAIPGRANHAFDTYGYNMAALEVFAASICRYVLKSSALNWDLFWEYARHERFFFRVKEQ
ncbi:MAG: phage terminase large subunit family protein [Treponema sp.]|nr:phage terminase large subunit family protein [Treponema sp.]